jgi:hypothetical protein
MSLGAFPASFLLPLYFLVYVSLYSLGPYLRIDCYSRLRFLTILHTYELVSTQVLSLLCSPGGQ